MENKTCFWACVIIFKQNHTKKNKPMLSKFIAHLSEAYNLNKHKATSYKIKLEGIMTTNSTQGVSAWNLYLIDSTQELRAV